MAGNEEFLAFLRRNAERYQEIKHLSNRVELDGGGYAHNRYRVKLDDETRQLSKHDLVVLCDDGNACFGGHVDMAMDFAAVTVYTD